MTSEQEMPRVGVPQLVNLHRPGSVLTVTIRLHRIAREIWSILNSSGHSDSEGSDSEPDRDSESDSKYHWHGLVTSLCGIRITVWMLARWLYGWHSGNLSLHKPVSFMFATLIR